MKSKKNKISNQYLPFNTNYKDCSKSRIKFLFRLSLTFTGWLSPVYIHGGLSEQFSGPQADFRTTSTVTGGNWKAGTSFLNHFISFVSDSIKASRNLMVYFLPTKRQLQIMKTITNHNKK
jgi:hypothetical protein